MSVNAAISINSSELAKLEELTNQWVKNGTINSSVSESGVAESRYVNDAFLTSGTSKDTSGATAKESGAYNWVAPGTPLPPHQSTFKTDVFDATVKTVTDADAITQELRMSGSSAANETTDTSGAKLKVLTSGTTTSTAYDSTITGTKIYTSTPSAMAGTTYYADGAIKTDAKGGTDYTANSSYTSTETDCTWKTVDINALTAATTSWNGSSSEFALNLNDVAGGKVTTDFTALCTACNDVFVH